MSRTTDRTKLAAQWLPADVMRNKHHERECTYSRVIHYDDGSAEVDESCICDRLRACEQRVRGKTITDVIGLLEQSTITAAALGEQGWQRLQNDLIEYRKVGFSD